MTDAGQDTRENRVRRMFQGLAFEVGLGVFFIGLGIQSSIIHGSQMTQYGQSNAIHIAMFADTFLFLIGAAAITKGMRTLGKALMLIAGMNPRWPQSNP